MHVYNASSTPYLEKPGGGKQGRHTNAAKRSRNIGRSLIIPRTQVDEYGTARAGHDHLAIQALPDVLPTGNVGENHIQAILLSDVLSVCRGPPRMREVYCNNSHILFPRSLSFQIVPGPQHW